MQTRFRPYAKDRAAAPKKATSAATQRELLIAESPYSSRVRLASTLGSRQPAEPLIQRKVNFLVLQFHPAPSTQFRPDNDLMALREGQI